MREDAILLYGFADAAERDWFRLLTTVQGVGGRVALSILSVLSPRDLVGAIAAGDKAGLTRAAGVGPRLAIRLLTELRDKVGAMPTPVGVSYTVSDRAAVGGGRCAVRPGQPGLPATRSAADSGPRGGTAGRDRHARCLDP